MKIGVYYYPEQWPREQWRRDFDNIAALGLQIVHMAEFAWFTLESGPGKFQFDWLSECLDLATKRRLSVILCTPTAAPPIWLSSKFPDILLRDQHGTPLRHGGRRHYSPTSPVLHEATQRIVSAMADRFGDHPSVIGWQIDNEYSGPFGQNDHTHAAFREFLATKYQTIENLNRAWGNQFWNTYYTDFSQILFPVSRDPRHGNPHQHLDASRFWSCAYAAYNKLQTDILRPKIGKRFLTTNYMPFHLDCNPADMAGDLDLISWDSYPVTGWVKAPKDETYRLADPSGIGIVHDQMASYHNRWALMEIQPGQINWSGVPVLLYPGAVRLWLWTAFAHGAEFITSYRFRQPRFGAEMFHHGLIGHDGVTPTPGGREFQQTIDEVARLDLTKIPPLADDIDPKRTVGLIFDFDQLWWYATLPQARRWKQVEFLTAWYRAIMRMGYRVKILHPGQAIPANLAMVIAPGVQMVDSPFIQQLTDYAAGGGQLLLTCRTALMDRSGQFFEGPTAKPILDLIGGTIEAYDSMPEEAVGHVEFEGKTYTWNVWADLLYAAPDTRTLARYSDQFYSGAAAVIQCKYQKGLVTYCGLYADQAFINDLVERLLIPATPATGPAPSRSRKTSAPAPAPVITALPDRVHLLRRGPYRILLNYRDAPTDAPAPRNAKFLVGSRKVDPASVAVWEE